MKKTILLSIAFSIVFFTHWTPVFAQLLPALPVNQLINDGTVSATNTPFDYGNIRNVFDVNFNTLARCHSSNNPMRITLSFDTPIQINGSSALSATPAVWTLETANSMEDLTNGSGTYSLLFSEQPLLQNTFGPATFPLHTIKVIRITLRRTNSDYYPHLRDWVINGEPVATNDFTIDQEVTGVTLYKREITCASNTAAECGGVIEGPLNEYVHVIDLSAGANLVSLMAVAQQDNPVCNGISYPNPFFYINHLGPAGSEGAFNWWENFTDTYSAQQRHLFSVINGAFASGSGSHTFPLKDANVQNNAITSGFAWNVETDRNKPARAFKIFGSSTDARADVVPYDEISGCPIPPSDPYFTNASKVIIGFDNTVNTAELVNGRTYLGVTELEGSLFKKVIVYSTNCATQEEATAVMASFGVLPAKIVQLDGGGSSQLVVEGDYKVYTDGSVDCFRPISHAIGIYGVADGSSQRSAQLSVALTAFPNPAVRSFDVRVKNNNNITNQPVRLNVVNDMGQIVKTVYSGKLEKNTNLNMHVSDLKPGIYFCKLLDVSGRAIETIRVVLK